jgi:3-oxoacyl-[acyl-carrier protein] reductase
MNASFTGKVALVVGAARGVGRAYALGLAAAGAQVAAVDWRVLPTETSGASLQEVMETARAQGGSILGLGADVNHTAEIKRTVDETLAHFGRIDVLIFNAMYATHTGALEVSDEDWDRSLNLNVRAPYTYIKLVAPQMMQRRSGAIVLMSTRASLAIPIEDAAHAGLLAYGVSKAGLNRIASYFAEELKPYNIAVNMLSPGKVHELAGGKTPTVERFAPPMLHLCSQTAETMTGQWRNTTDWGVSWP